MQVKDKHKDRRGMAVLALVCFLLQVVVSPNVSLGYGHVDFCTIFAGVYALLNGGRSAVGVGFASGLVFDLLSTGPVGLMAGLLTVFSYVLGLEERNRFADGLVAPLSAFGVGSFVVTVVYLLAMVLLGLGDDVGSLVLLRALPTFAMTFLGFVPFAYLQVRGSGKASGLGGAGRGRNASHYDIRNL